MLKYGVNNVLTVAGQFRLHLQAADPGGERGRPVVWHGRGEDKPLEIQL